MFHRFSPNSVPLWGSHGGQRGERQKIRETETTSGTPGPEVAVDAFCLGFQLRLRLSDSIHIAKTYPWTLCGLVLLQTF